jgi:uncharacterized protein
VAVRTDPGGVLAPRRPRRPDEVRPGVHPPRPGQPQRPRPPRRTPPTVAIPAVLITLLLGALMNGPGLQDAATGLPVGTTRDAAMSLAAGVSRGGAALGLDRPHRWLSAARDSDLGSQLGGAALGAADRPAPGQQPDHEVDGGVTTAGDTGEDPAVTAENPGAAATAQPQATAPTDGTAREHDRIRRPITPDAPLEVLLAGDSLIGAIADGYGRRSLDDELVDWDKDVRISTGLARPDVLDWPLHLQQLLDARDPDVVVLLLGGNDDQSLVGGADRVVHYGQPGWEEEYQARVARLQTIAASQGRTVVWLELPSVRPGRLEQARQRMNAAARGAAAETGALVIDTDAILAPQGYTPRLAGVQVRADDGVHLTHPGGDLVAEVIHQVVSDRFGLPSG